MVATTTVLASLLLPGFCQASLTGTDVGGIGAGATCQWHVADQTITVEAPVIYDVDVGTHCPFAGFGKLHEEVCEECEGLDNKCGGEFVACAGCCKSPKTSRYHSCTHIRNYFFERNSATVACDDRIDLSDGDVNVEYGEETTQRSENSGTLSEECEAPVIKADTEGVPVKLKFDCTACAVQGVPNLLQQCCDKAEGFQTSSMVRKLKDDGFSVFLWADGCNKKWIGEDDSIEFPHAYPALAEAAINSDMITFIDERYCSKSRNKATDTCPSSRRLHGQDRGLLLNSTRRLDAGDDCPWLSQDVEVVKETKADPDATDAAAGLSSSLAATLVGGGIACLAL